MRILLSVDVELWSWRGEFEADVAEPLRALKAFASREGVPIMLFTSLSNKGVGPDTSERYLERLHRAIDIVADESLLDFGVHTHCVGLPMSFRTDEDRLSSYRLDEVSEIISWSREILKDWTGRDVIVHRAAGYELPVGSPEEVGSMLYDAGVLIDSSSLDSEYSRMSMLGPVLEVPPATCTLMAERQQVWSADNMDLEAMLRFRQTASTDSDVLVLTCHSFLMSNPALYRPDSLLVRVWFSLPGSLQQALRPGLALTKRVLPKTSPNGPKRSTQTSGEIELLSELISHLRDDGCEFSVFGSLIPRTVVV